MYIAVEFMPLIIFLMALLVLLGVIIVKIIWLVARWWQCQTKEKKYIILFLIILSLLPICLYQEFRPQNIEFTRFVQGKTWALQHDNITYKEHILIKNMPKDTLKQNKIMIAYFDSAGLSKNYFSIKMPEVRYYSISFYKSTSNTRRHFAKLDKYWIENKSIPDVIRRKSLNWNNVNLGGIGMVRCKDDTTKWRIFISRHFRAYEFLKRERFYTITTLLLNECGDNWYESEKDKERGKVLVEYYMELRNKKNAEP